eukprot:30294-Pelagococcus_subviridis.AAC.66
MISRRFLDLRSPPRPPAVPSLVDLGYVVIAQILRAVVRVLFGTIFKCKLLANFDLSCQISSTESSAHARSWMTRACEP